MRPLFPALRLTTSARRPLPQPCTPHYRDGWLRSCSSAAGVALLLNGDGDATLTSLPADAVVEPDLEPVTEVRVRTAGKQSMP